jgi:hypothetical protein
MNVRDHKIRDLEQIDHGISNPEQKSHEILEFFI